MSNSSIISKAHPFELSGMGVGPYSFGGVYEMPNLSENSASNFGNSDPYAEVNSLKLKGGAGTCQCCGMAITVICVVVDAAGVRYGVGSDCVEKIDQPSLKSAAKVAIAKRRNRMARVRKEAKRQAEHAVWLTKASTDSRAQAGETNAQFRERLTAEQAAAELVTKAKQAAKAAKLKAYADVVRDGRGGFCDSIAGGMDRGYLPSGNGLRILIEILARQHGRTGSKAYETAYDEIHATLIGIEEAA